MPEGRESVVAGPDYVGRVTRRWIEAVVIDLNLCPFARRELDDGRVEVIVTPALTEAELLAALDEALDQLARCADIETTVLVHPQVLQAFEAYLDFLPLADGLLRERREEGVFQVASFHPDYCFADAGTEEASNFSNRSPYPMLHILRETSVERAVDAHPDTGEIPRRNVALLDALGPEALERRWRACFDV
jgi:hypothetical protein